MSHNPVRSPEAETNATRLPTPATQPLKEPEVNKFFRIAMKHNASDLHLKVGQSPLMRVLGVFHLLEHPPLNQEDLERLTLPLLTPRQKTILVEEGGVSFSHVVGQDECRFRLSLFRQRGKLSLVAARVNTVIPSFKELSLPDPVAELCNFSAGLIILAGAPGSGRRTTVAAMLDHINERERLHILTIEDSIKFHFIDKKACVNQREIGIDVHDRHKALQGAIRQDPDVLFVGELRDAETFEAAIHAAQTGQRVFGISNAFSTPSAIPMKKPR